MVQQACLRSRMHHAREKSAPPALGRLNSHNSDPLTKRCSSTIPPSDFEDVESVESRFDALQYLSARSTRDSAA